LAKRTHPAEARENDTRILPASIQSEADVMLANGLAAARSAAQEAPERPRAAASAALKQPLVAVWRDFYYNSSSAAV
jgi:hypothetical protein